MPEHDIERLRVVFTSIVTNSLALGGRITVAADPFSPKANGSNQICAAAIWEPPNVRLEIRLSTIPTFIRNGFWGLFRTFGWRRFHVRPISSYQST